MVYLLLPQRFILFLLLVLINSLSNNSFFMDTGEFCFQWEAEDATEVTTAHFSLP